MKKVLCLIGLLLIGSFAAGTPVLADTYTGVAEGSTPFVGKLGQFDPSTEDPNNQLPPAGDQAWVKVALPTKIAYWSTAESNHVKITSTAHTITNLSNYPVKVSLSDFAGKTTATPDVSDVKKLSLNGQDLVANGALVPLPTLNQALGAGGSNPAVGTFTKANTWQLSVAGETSGNLTTSKTLENKLVFQFKALDADGNEVPAP